MGGGMYGLKASFGLIRSLVPVLYCGGLVYYFLDQCGGSVETAETIGLGPYLLGLTVVGLLFCIPLIVKIVLILSILLSPRSGGRHDPDGSGHDGEFDADAVLARYNARRAAEDAPSSRAAPPAHEGGGPARRPSFGRKIR